MSAEKTLIDTSVWIDYFKNESSIISQKVDKILTEHEVYVPKIILAELIQGAESEGEISIIEEFVDAFNIIDHREDTWIRAGKLSYKLKKKGRPLNLTDCYIAVIAHEYNCRIFTLDKHFREIQKIFDIQIIDQTL